MAQSMKGFVCWNDDMIERVMDPDALEIPEHLFLATHNPIKMYKETTTDTTISSVIEYDEESFLKDFLKPSHYIFSTILGEAGTGKTHLIRWLHSKLPKENNKRRVILIPRSGTNLKRILETILEGMEGQVFDQYRMKLTNVAENLTPAKARETLLNHIALAIGPHGAHGMQNLSDEQEYFVETLPSLFQDVFFRKILLEENQIIDRLAEHILGRNEKALRLESRREFTVEDLPLKVRDINRASTAAQEIYAALTSDADLKEEAVQWINKNMNEAITQMLSFKGTDLFNLMTDIREELGKQEIELVILIEDFAMLQGIDFQLLDALLVRPNQHSRRLCNLRVAMACTTGYFQTLPDTVQHRVELRVNLDVKAGNSLFTNSDMEIFVGRYMNALRFKDDELTDWYNRNLEVDSPEALTSKCIDCPFMDHCHDAFGNREQLGLYPFNSEAIQTMYQRLSSSDSPSFNPRIMIKDVLRHTLSNYGHHIKDGTFPPPALIQHFGGSRKKRLNAINLTKLKSLDQFHTDRREVLLELWSNTNEIIDLNHGIHEAFGIPELGVPANENQTDEIVSGNQENTQTENKEQKSSNQNGNIPTITPEPNGSQKPEEIDSGKNGEIIQPPPPQHKYPTHLQDKLDVIERWKNGDNLPQTIAQDLREHLFEAITTYIDWDSELLSLSWYKNKKLWKNTCINFERQHTQVPKSIIKLMVPVINDELNDTAIVLGGIFLFKHYKHWDFKDGKVYFRYFAQYIEKWSNHILKQLKQIKINEKDSFNPLPVAVEVLAVGSALRGKFVEESKSLQVSELFEKMIVPDSSIYSNQWTRVLNDYMKDQNEVRDLLLSKIGCTKGGSRDYKIIDASQLLTSLDTILKAGTLTLDIEVEHNEFKELKRIYEYLKRNLVTLAENEKTEKIQQLALLKAVLGEHSSLTELKKHLARAINFSAEEGCYVGPERTILLQMLEGLEEERLIKCMKDLAALTEEENTILLINKIGQLDHPFLVNTLSLIGEVNEFIQRTATKVERDIADLNSEASIQELDQMKKEITEHFNLLKNMLDSMQGSETNVN